MNPQPRHSFAAGQVVRDARGSRYVVTDSRWTAILERTLGDGPVAYHLGDGSAYEAVPA